MEKAVRRCWSGRISVGLLVDWMIMIERCCWLGWMRSRRRRAEQGSEWAGDVSQSDVWAKFMGDFLFVGFTPRLFAGKQSGVYSGSSGWRGGEWRAMRNFRGGDLNELMDSLLVGWGRMIIIDRQTDRQTLRIVITREKDREYWHLCNSNLWTDSSEVVKWQGVD